MPGSLAPKVSLEPPEIHEAEAPMRSGNAINAVLNELAKPSVGRDSRRFNRRVPEGSASPSPGGGPPGPLLKSPRALAAPPLGWPRGRRIRCVRRCVIDTRKRDSSAGGRRDLSELVDGHVGGDSGAPSSKRRGDSSIRKNVQGSTARFEDLPLDRFRSSGRLIEARYPRGVTSGRWETIRVSPPWHLDDSKYGRGAVPYDRF